MRGLERNDNEPQAYLPYRQVPDGQLFYAPKDLVVRFAAAAPTLAPAIREIVKRIDPQLPITDMQLLTEVVDLETAPRTAQVRVLGGFAIIASILAAIGIHGMLAFVILLVILQLWLLTATMNAYLGRDEAVIWPAAGASAFCLLLNAGLLRYLYVIDRVRR